MTRTRLARWAAAACVIALSAAAGAWWASQRQGEARAPAAAAAKSPVSVVDGLTVVQVDPAVQQRSGIESRPAQRAGGEAMPSSASFPGVVLDLQPLIEWRGQLAAARTQADAAAAQLRTSEAELARTRALHADDQNASRKALEAAQGTQARDRAQQEAAQAALRALEQKGREQFGPVLSRTEVLDALLARHDAVVALAIPGAPPPRVEVEAASTPAVRSTWLSAAARTDASLGAGLQLYLVPRSLPANAAVVARVAAATPAGALVPPPAVVWQAGQPWAYVRRDDSHFARTPLTGATETREGFVVPQGIRPGDQIVTQGAQLLLSQELLPPPGGPACKDPECD